MKRVFSDFLKSSLFTGFTRGILPIVNLDDLP